MYFKGKAYTSLNFKTSFTLNNDKKSTSLIMDCNFFYSFLHSSGPVPVQSSGKAY